MSKDLLWACFDYPFIKLEKKVILATLDAENKEAIRLNRHLGFQDKCVIENAHENGDLLIMTMKREDCKWLNLNAPLRKLQGE
jgi:RimJ/RimL family protein N-acetyltransferase